MTYYVIDTPILLVVYLCSYEFIVDVNQFCYMSLAFQKLFLLLMLVKEQLTPNFILLIITYYYYAFYTPSILLVYQF